jgi:hypothetical protein
MAGAAKAFSATVRGLFPAAIAGMRDRMLERAMSKRMRRLGAASGPILAQAMYTAAMKTMVPWIQSRIKGNRSVFRGHLHQKITAKAVIKAPVYGVDFGALSVKYSLNVEKGAGPHKPDYRKLLQYVKKKMGMRGEDAKRVAIKIGQTIESSGSKPHAFIMPVWEAGQKAFRREVIMRANVAFKLELAKPRISPKPYDPGTPVI